MIIKRTSNVKFTDETLSYLIEKGESKLVRLSANGAKKIVPHLIEMAQKNSEIASCFEVSLAEAKKVIGLKGYEDIPHTIEHGNTVQVSQKLGDVEV